MGRYFRANQEWKWAKTYAERKALDEVFNDDKLAKQIIRSMNLIQFTGIIEYAFPTETFFSPKQNKQMSHQRFLITEQVEQGYRGNPQQMVVDVWSTSMAIWMNQNLGQLATFNVVHRVSKDRNGYPKFNNIVANGVSVNGIQVNFEQQQPQPAQPQYPPQYAPGQYQQPMQGQYYQPQQQGYMQQPMAAPQQPTQMPPGVYKASEIPPMQQQQPTSPTPPPATPQQEEENDLPF